MPVRIKKIVVGELQTNCYIVFERDSKQCAVIDPGGDFQKIREFLKTMDLEAKVIINTHGHRDHIGANEGFGLPVYIHKLDKEFLFNPELNLSSLFDVPFRCKVNTHVVEDQNRIEIGKLIFEVIHTPGHTPGGICLKLRDNLFSGDTLFAQGVGRTDFAYGSESDLFRSIKKKLFTLDDKTNVFPGHGEATTIGKEKQYLVAKYY